MHQPQIVELIFCPGRLYQLHSHINVIYNGRMVSEIFGHAVAAASSGSSVFKFIPNTIQIRPLERTEHNAVADILHSLG